MSDKNTDIQRIECGARMSEAVIFGGLVYLAGQVGNPGESVTAQTTEVLAQIDRLLALAGTDKTRILKAQIWVADMADFAEMNAVWDAWVPPAIAPHARRVKLSSRRRTTRSRSSSPPRSDT